MSTLTALARVQAAAAGVAQPVATVAHLHVAARPLVCVPLTLAGETNATLAVAVGGDPATPTVLIVPQPRDRDLAAAFAADFAAVVLSYLDGCRGEREAVAVERGRQVRQRYRDAPQVWVPNPGGVAYLALLGRALRFRGPRPDGSPADPGAADAARLGCWLTFLADRAELPGSALVVPATTALAGHWATGQSAVEDGHLGALLAWIAPPEGCGGAGAAAAEDPAVCPPAGPATDPGFDRDVLAPLTAAHDRGKPGAQARLREALAAQVLPTWRLVWQAYDLLAALPPGASVPVRWAQDRDAFTAYAAHLDDGGGPQPRRDSAVAAAARLHRMERAAAAYAWQRAYDDPLVLAEYRLTGEAFAGEVVVADPDRVDDSGRRRVPRPRLTVRSDDPVAVPVGATVCAPARPRQKGCVVAVTGREVVIELRTGMGRGRSPEAGSVPEVGERLTYTTLVDAYAAAPALPPVEETPWTHGGPPAGPDDAGAADAGSPAGPDDAGAAADGTAERG